MIRDQKLRVPLRGGDGLSRVLCGRNIEFFSNFGAVESAAGSVMRVEIRNTTSGNQGAQLMMRAIVDRLRSEPGCEAWRFTVARRCATGATRQELQLDLLPWMQTLGTQADLLARLVPPFFPDSVSRAADIELVLDASGFAYGDSWGPGNARMAAAYYGRLKAHGAKIILLPQALGPVKNPEVRAALAEVVGLADLVYARDPTSLEAIRAVGGNQDHVRQSNDFTHALKGLPPDPPLPAPMVGRTVGLIPNKKMLQKGAASRAEYLGLFSRIARILMERQWQPLLILHSREDGALAAAINRELPRPVPTRRERHPLRLKGLIGQCQAVVSSRFHGLVNAMSAAVPAMATSWSHKYQHLMEDFDCTDLLVGPDLDDETLEAKLTAMLDAPERDERVDRLRDAAAGQLQNTEQMWQDVLRCVRSSD
jgi:polysaccharide pyruvyl transferase WcaK-like protein